MTAKSVAASRGAKSQFSGAIPLSRKGDKPPEGNEWGFWALIGIVALIFVPTIIGQIFMLSQGILFAAVAVVSCIFIVPTHAFSHAFLGERNNLTRFLGSIMSIIERWGAWATTDRRTPKQIAEQKEQDRFFEMAAVASMAADKVVRELKGQRK